MKMAPSTIGDRPAASPTEDVRDYANTVRMTPFPNGMVNRDIRRGHGPRFRHRGSAGRWSQQWWINLVDAIREPAQEPWTPRTTEMLRDVAIVAVHDRMLPLESMLARLAPDRAVDSDGRNGDAEFRTWPHGQRRKRVRERARPPVPLVIVTPLAPRAPAA